MHRERKLALFLTLTALVSLVAGLTPFAQAPVAAQAPNGTTIIYNLYATDGYMNLADGTRAYVYGFIGGRQGMPVQYLDANGVLQTLASGAPAPTAGAIAPAELPLAGNAQVPAPIIYAKVGDVVEIRLKNLGTTVRTAPNDPHTIHLHGLDVDAANDGVPETSVAAVPANVANPGAGNVVVYMFTANRPGTYMYHCHQEADIHVQMGMYGALVIYNSTDAAAAVGPGQGAGGDLYGWQYDKDYVMLLTEVDTRQHVSEEFALATRPPAGVPFNPADYDPQYWLINGISFPNTVHVAGAGAFNWASWIASHPGYDPFITGRPGGPAQKVLVRVINLGFENQPMHIHGFHPKIIGADQRPWPWANDPAKHPTGSGLERNTFMVASGQSYELLIDFTQQAVSSTYPSGPQSLFADGTQSRVDAAGMPLSNTNLAGLPMPDPFAPGSFYISGPQVDGITGPTQPVAGSGQFFPWHNHDDYKSTNNGVYPGGQFTMVKLDPVPAAGTPLSITAVNAVAGTGGQIVLTWVNPVDAARTGIVVERSIDAAFTAPVNLTPVPLAPTATTFTDADPALVPGTLYYYRVSALGAAATTPATNVAIGALPTTFARSGGTFQYWRNTPSAWPPTGYSQTQTVVSVFSAASAYPTLGSSTLQQALYFQNAAGVQGAAGSLLRSGVASLLNASHPNVVYPRSAAQVISDVNAALASGNRNTMMTLSKALHFESSQVRAMVLFGFEVDAGGLGYVPTEWVYLPLTLAGR